MFSNTSACVINLYVQVIACSNGLNILYVLYLCTLIAPIKLPPLVPFHYTKGGEKSLAHVAIMPILPPINFLNKLSDCQCSWGHLPNYLQGPSTSTVCCFHGALAVALQRWHFALPEDDQYIQYRWRWWPCFYPIHCNHYKCFLRHHLHIPGNWLTGFFLKKTMIASIVVRIQDTFSGKPDKPPIQKSSC